MRAALSADLAALAELLRESDALHARLQPGFFRAGTSEALALAELSRALVDRHAGLLVAERRGAIVGMAHVAIYDTPRRPSMRPRRRAHVESLVVVEAERRGGIGGRLMEAVEEWAREHGAEQLSLTVWEGNPAAQAFYARRGYTRVSSVLARELEGDE